jgi:hypothetical protein
LNTKEIDLWKARSIYSDRDSYYHLHPELIKESQEGPRTCLCSLCDGEIITNRKVPEHLLAAGVDFGSYIWISLTLPNLSEQLILAHIRRYETQIKFQRQSLHEDHELKCDKLNNRERLQGHVILFEHNAHSVAKGILVSLQEILDLI